MNLLTKAVRGTQDILPRDSYKIRYVEKTVMEIAENFGFKEIRTPVFEHTELFARSVGDTTDVVQKEMYTFEDKGGRSITLRPEGTAGVARAVLENGLLGDAAPLRASYITSCYRYEKPQAGRLREFHQFGVEMFGTASPAADAEVICLAKSIIDTLGLENISLQINSIGCPKCRARYLEALREYFGQYKDRLCETCLGRLERNPMRILDCKSEVCSEIAKGAPAMTDFLCDECWEHFKKVQAFLDAAGVYYTVNTSIVRGLDYYTKTVFEFVSDDIGSQGTVCGGGRYDGLIEELGGPATCGLGFGMGLERILLVMENQGCDFPQPDSPMIYLAPMTESAALECFSAVKTLRDEGFYAQTDVCGRGLKAQMKYANKIGAQYVAVVGEEELASGKIKLKDMESGAEKEINMADILDALYDISYDRTIGHLTEVAEKFGDPDKFPFA
ncbi:MAG: histidine--tRNA ligase [Clostridia bacterium]|nr:histidine--tRNA ligase [Clostridia bacterium]